MIVQLSGGQVGVSPIFVQAVVDGAGVAVMQDLVPNAAIFRSAKLSPVTAMYTL